MKNWLATHSARFASFEAREAEQQRRRTQKTVDQMGEHSTPDARIAAAKARLRRVLTKIEQVAAESEAEEGPQARAVPVDINGVRIDDLRALFSLRHQLPEWLQDRIKTVHAKVNWRSDKGKRGPFNVAVNNNNIPVDKHLAILAHLKGGTEHGTNLDTFVEPLLECGLFFQVRKSTIHSGKRRKEIQKFGYGKRCQNGEECLLCNYINVTDGVKVLSEAYDEAAFSKGGGWFAITVAPRTDPRTAKVTAGTIRNEDWDRANPNSIVFHEGHQGRAFQYPEDATDVDDWYVESAIRRFLGAVQFVFGKLVKNGWFDGIRGKVENSIEFLPFASHQHWHGVGCSKTERDPLKVAKFIKTEVDLILARTCSGLYADVMVATIPTPDDLTRWISYTNKIVNLSGPIDSVYNRFPHLRRGDAMFEQLIEELRRYPVRSRRVFAMIRRQPAEIDERGTHTFMLRRRYVGGNHRFGTGSILSEPERHRLWREGHADKKGASKKLHLLRRRAAKLGLGIAKCRARNPGAAGFGTYHIFDQISRRILAAGESGCFGLTLKLCENTITRIEKSTEE